MSNTVNSKSKNKRPSSYTAYEYFGAHVTKLKASYKTVFRVWAPRADYVSLVSDMTDWQNGWGMERKEDGIWELTVKTDYCPVGCYYKYAVTKDGRRVLKSDPYAFYSQTLGESASIVWAGGDFEWHDDIMRKNSMTSVPVRYSKKFERDIFYPDPMNIYEVHLASWKKTSPDAFDGGYLNYREIAPKLAAYAKSLGYTHVEIMPVTEYPFDGSWGYQVCSYYAPSSRFGNPDDFKFFVDTLHEAGLGLIMDWVPAHFPKDEYGLIDFDGTACYEYEDWSRKENAGWGTRYFDLGKWQVIDFLISNAMYWIREYHIDGLRVDAVSAMLYLDYDRKDGEWKPNKYGDNKNLEAIEFLQRLNDAVHTEFPGALMIAEESTAYPLITRPPKDGGLGFSFKWNMGFANDLFDYMTIDPYFRSGSHNRLTFPMMYAYSENYILPISHDEVVHGKRSLIDKAYGSYEEKFATMRTFLAYMMTMPGKKMMFMGTEYAQFSEWNFQKELEWFMTDYPMHKKMQDYVKRLNLTYLSEKAMWEIDDGWEGFEWLQADDCENCTVVYERHSESGDETVSIVNFAGNGHENYRIPNIKGQKYEVLINTDEEKYGGTGASPELKEGKKLTVRKTGENAGLTVNIPPMSALILKKIDIKKKPAAKSTKGGK